MFKPALIALSLLATTACVPVFDMTPPLKITFDAQPMSTQPMTYADTMCCYECVV